MTPHGNWSVTCADLDAPSVPEVPSALRALVKHQFVALVDQPHFPCLGAKAAMRRKTYLHNVYADLRTPTTLKLLRVDLEYFTQARADMGGFCTFAASFTEPAAPLDPAAWYDCVWEAIGALLELDRSPWDDRFSRNPHDGDFAVSLFGCGYLLVALYPGAERFARRFAWPTLIFNPAEQDHMNFPEPAQFLAFRDRIRARDAKLQGISNPSLPPTQEFTQATGFAGTSVDPLTWSCPIDIHHRPA